MSTPEWMSHWNPGPVILTDTHWGLECPGDKVLATVFEQSPSIHHCQVYKCSKCPLGIGRVFIAVLYSCPSC